MTAAALSFLLVMAVGGMVCGLADLAQGIAERLVTVSVTVTECSEVSGRVVAGPRVAKVAVFDA